MADIRQEMPPKGGYAGIQWERIPLKKPISGFKLFAGYLAITLGSFYVYGRSMHWKRNVKRENDDVTVAIEPLLIAERDRMFLDQLRKNREEEAELMKNVPGWVVGTWYGEPVYKTIGDNIIDPSSAEYYAHTQEHHREDMHMYRMWL